MCLASHELVSIIYNIFIGFIHPELGCAMVIRETSHLGSRAKSTLKQFQQ